MEKGNKLSCTGINTIFAF